MVNIKCIKYLPSLGKFFCPGTRQYCRELDIRYASLRTTFPRKTLAMVAISFSYTGLFIFIEKIRQAYKLSLEICSNVIYFAISWKSSARKRDMAIIGHSVLASWYSSVFLSEIFIAFHCLVFLKDSIPLLKRRYLVIWILICQSLSTKLLKLYHTNPRVGVIDHHIYTPCPYSLLSFAKLSLKF